MQQDLNGRTAVICGGLNLLGKGLVQSLAERGCAVVIWDDQYDFAFEFLKECKAKGYQVEYFQADLRKLMAVESAKEQTLKVFPVIDYLINCKGVTDAHELPEKNFSQLEFSRLADLNLTAAMNSIRSLSPLFQENKKGRIINTTVIPVVHQYWDKHHDSALREGVVGITKVWSRELAKFGITVNTLSPGFMEILPGPKQTQVTKVVLTRIPSGRLCEIKDIENACLFLLSDLSEYITGITLPVDGGYTG